MQILKSPLYSFLRDIGKVAELVKDGAVGVIPTDTLYGLVASVRHKDSIERLYEARGRDKAKPCIILISDVRDLSEFGVIVDDKLKNNLMRLWPGMVSIILDCPGEEYSYLHRGTKTLAFRLPKDEWLLEFLKISGPVAAPSANPEGESPARTIQEAREYFGDKADFYANDGEKYSQPSTLVRYTAGTFSILRQGAGKISL